ncbi:MAG: biotin transporter BioY [Oscillospiraceae bacterium]|nr:biotin transporter BioY [Oscillospiraceae bacterium]
MAQCALFAALMCICAWICVPLGDGAFTLQTFGLFLALELLGGKRGSLVCLVYLLLGAAGLPVFAGFRGGLGVLLSTTGGYIWGFLFAALVYWGITHFGGNRLPVRLLALLSGLALCYGLGTVWFMGVYAGGRDAMGLWAVLAKCVAPYLLPDGLKLALALVLAPKLRRHLRC